MLILHAIIHNTPDVGELIAGMEMPFPVEVQTIGKLAAITSSIPGIDETVFEDADKLATFAAEHNTLLMALSEKIDLVPIRIGAAHSSAYAVEQLVAGRSEMFLDLLEQVSGAIEITLKVTDRKPAKRTSQESTSTTRSGRDYLRARSDARKRTQNRGALRQQLMTEIVDCMSRPPSALIKNVQMKNELSVLVYRARVDEFLDVLGSYQAKAERENFIINAIGPWPPYSFVEEAA